MEGWKSNSETYRDIMEKVHSGYYNWCEALQLVECLGISPDGVPRYANCCFNSPVISINDSTGISVKVAYQRPRWMKDIYGI